MIESSRFLAAWRGAVKLAAMRARKAEGHETFTNACGVMICLWMPRPANPEDPLWPTGKPDYDKLARAVNDSLTSAGVWADDSQVIEATERKRWATDAELPGASIVVWEVPT